MTGFAAVGQLPVAAAPGAYGTNYSQSVSAAVSTSVFIVRNVGKEIDAVIASAVTFTKAVSFSIRIACAPAITVIKSVDFRMANAVVLANVLVVKNTLKSIQTSAVSVSALMTREIGKIISPVVSLDVTVLAAGLFVTSRRILQDAVDYVLAGTQPLKSSGREWEKHDPNIRTTTRGMKSGLKNLSGVDPSFTVTTSPPKPPKRT